jgi:hypothetical protein
MLQHLGIKYSGDGENYEIDHMVCQYNTFMDDMNYAYGGGVDAHYSVDHLVPNQSTCLYKSDDGFGRTFAISNDVYKAISSSVIFGAFKNEDSLRTRPYLMAEMINFLLGITTITSLSDLMNNEAVSVMNYPNPFTSSTNFEFSLRESGNIRLEIFDELGRLVHNESSEQIAAGKHIKTWDATNQQGNRVRSGMYFYKLTSGEKVNSGKFMLMD